MPVRIVFFILLSCLCGFTLAVAQESEAAPPTISEIVVEFVGLRNVSDEIVLANVQVRPGQEFDQNLVDRSIRTLYDTRLFDFIEVKTETVPGNQVKLILSIQPKYRVRDILIVGNERVSDRRLFQEISSTQNRALDERTVRKDRDAIYEYYLSKGYSLVTVDYEIDRNEETGFGTVRFIVDEGTGKLRIRDIEFVGNREVSSKKLRKQLETKEYGPFSWLLGSGRFEEAKFQEDLDKLREYYKDLGYLDISIEESDVTLEYPSSNRIDITINIDEGTQYRVGDIEFEGNTLFPSDRLALLPQLNTGDVFSPSTLDEDTETITDVYGRVGYLDTNVRVDRRPNLATGAIDLTYVIDESDKFFVESINIEGNTKTKSVVILRELALAPGSVFDMVRMKNSQSRLENTQFFDEVNLSPEPTNIPQRRNLKVSVVEGRTGQFQFGAGFSSLENAVFFLELSQGNFDLFNWRSFFQGDGQKFRVRLQLGSDSNQFVVTFEEPWLFEQRLALGFEFYRSETDYVSSVYNELRSGIEVYLRRRLFGLWEGRLAYRYEVVDIFDVSPFASPIIRAEAGERTVSKISFNLLRDTRNSFLFPTRGSRMSILTELAGLGGDTEYYKFEARASRFFKTFEFGEQTLGILARAGTIVPYGDSDRIPFFDRYFLGGPDDVRGFDFREVGPKDPETGDPTGGNTMGFLSFEYLFKVADPLRLAVFYDIGIVNEGDSDFSTDNFNDSWGFGARIMVLGAPMRLDYGIPLATDRFNKDDGNQFHFTFGTRF